MNGLSQKLKRGLFLSLVLALLSACGQGGTEVGNPNQPHGGSIPVSGAEAPGDAAPAVASPTPGPQSLLIKDSKDSEDSQAGDYQPEDDGALIATPEET